MYQLYVKEETLEIKVTPLKAAFKNQKNIIEFLTDTPYDVFYYNENYRFCGKRAPLIALARNIKNEWLIKAKNLVQQIEEIKI